ncbi:hypothetical protein D3C87_1205560 [compost metagenome]
MRLTLLQPRQARLDSGDLRGGFGDVQIGRHTIGQTQLRQFQTVARDIEVLLGDSAGVLHATQLNVVVCGFSEHRQQHTTAVIFRDLKGSVGGFGFAAHAAPEIQFPGRGETAIPQVERGVAIVPRRVHQTFAAVAFTCIAAASGGTWITLGRHHLAHGAALLQAAAGELQVEVVSQGALTQRREFRIVEHFPPALIQGLVDGLAGGGF